MWDAAHDALSDAESLLIFGFSFPACDALIAQIVRETAVANRRLSRIGVIDVMPDPVIERMRKCLPKGLDVTFDGFAVPADGTEPAWHLDRAATGEL